MTNSKGGAWARVARVFVSVCGACSIAWAVSTYPAFRQEMILAGSVLTILSGEQYNAEQLSELQGEVGAGSAISVQPSALRDVAVVRLRLAEAKLASGQPPAAGLDDLQRSLDIALDRNPTGSFLWLMDYWVQKKRSNGAAANWRLLQMSYLTGPNDGWIAVRRNPIALDAFPSLPEEYRGKVVAEFAGLVRSWFYDDAARILTGPGWPVHQRLLDGLGQLDEGHRRGFAKLLEAKDIEDVVIPGVQQRPRRPF